ncbi:MAG TPA: phosphoribosylanthranilate isomerase [Vicinamibacterales bacterium]|nr:phosphoribosylanthranilate isomerase [Vicinamibacterales bacterium]
MIPPVKICGITTPQDALAAVSCGASALGLVFWPSSPRAVDAARAREILAVVPALVSVIGVFVNQVAEAKRLAAELQLSAVQFHGDESPDDCVRAGVRVIKAVPVKDASAIDAALALPESVTVLLDAHDPIKRGGTGAAIDWSIAREIARRRLTILSGGLTPENVNDALAMVRPWAIDVSSGVEEAPGRKDIQKMLMLFATMSQRPELKR